MPARFTYEKEKRMSLREISFTSYNGRDTVKGWVYTPIRKPKAVVQLVHGFGEHSRRYLHMIGSLLDAGYVVCADDHVAHGKTAHDSDTWGDPGDKGFMTYIEDEKSLHDLIAADFPGLPYFLFGHSWGSMIARGFAASYGKDLAGLLLCGVCAQLKGADILAATDDMRALVESGRGTEDGSAFQAVLFGGMTDRFDNPRTPNDWIAGDPDVVADHASDPFNNLVNPPTVQLIYDFVELYRFIESDGWAAMVPGEIPVYLIAGDMDPCCNYGEGLYHVANSLSNSGHKRVVVRSYSGERHEIHNEPHLRDTVERELIQFIESVL